MSQKIKQNTLPYRDKYVHIYNFSSTYIYTVFYLYKLVFVIT